MTFKDILGADQTIFSNHGALDPDFVPKLLPHREDQQKHVATCIKPIFFGRNGQHLLIKGAPGIGKTACVKRVLYDMEEETEGVTYVYVNCWNKNTTYKVLTGAANALGYKFTHNMSTDELLAKVEELSKKYQGIVYVFDEIDKAEDLNFLYLLLEEPCKKTVIVITSDVTWGAELDQRIMSRLMPETLVFPPYDFSETADILRERAKYAFFQDVWTEDALAKIVSRAASFKDIRVGIVLLKAAGVAAEDDSSKKILSKHAEIAIAKTDEIKIKTSAVLADDEKQVLELCKKNSGALIGDLFADYQAGGGEKTDRTFRNKLEKLASRGLVELKLIEEGVGGKSTRVTYKGFARTLDEFA